MKAIIVYQSSHHGNTGKLLDAIAQAETVELVDVSANEDIKLDDYQLIGFASGIAFSKYYPAVVHIAEEQLPRGKDVFFIHTGGDPRESQNAGIKAITDAKGCKCLGTYFAKGFDTFGPFKLFGGIAKGHPDAREIAGAVDFYRALLTKKTDA